MNQAWDKGPAGCFHKDAQATYWQPQPTGGYVTLTMTPETFKHDASACGFQVIPPGGRIPLQSHKAAEKVWYVVEGTAELTIDGQVRRLTRGVTVAMGRKVPHSLVNDGDTDLRLWFWVTPPGYEGLLADWGIARTEGDEAPTFAAVPPARSPMLFGEQTDVPAEDRAHWVVVEAEGGETFWQFPPAGGYMQWKSTTKTFPSNRFFACIQVLPPGGLIPPHSHTRNEEWLLIATGHGAVEVDGVEIPLETGSLCYVDRWVTHSIRNYSDVPMEVFVIFTPPGLEDVLPHTSIAKSEEYPVEPNWEEFFAKTPMPSMDYVDDVFEGTCITMPHNADKHNATVKEPVVF